MEKLQHTTFFDKFDLNKTYWTDGKNVYHRQNPIKIANLETFEHLHQIWAKDNKNCYCGSSKLQGADTATFQALNLSYAKDQNSVWVLAGKINEADAETFEACDDGKQSLGKSLARRGEEKFLHESFVPYGFGKDKNNVYYYDFQGKGKIVKKANPKTFISLNDSYFGYDDKLVFCGKSVIPKAKPESWIKLKDEFYYSKDGNNIYYFNRLIKDADAETFEVVELPHITGNQYQYAKDKNRAYWNDREISFEELQKEIDKRTVYYNQMVELLKQ